MTKKAIFFGALILIILIIIFSIFDIRKSKYEYLFEKEQYYKDSFNGKLKSLSINRGIRIYLESNGQIQKKYLYSSRNYNYNPCNLSKFLISGDSLVKASNSLDLFIYRNNNEYYFKLGEYINK